MTRAPVQMGHFLVPVSPNPNFVGREKDMTMLEGYLNPQEHQTSSGYPIVAVHGLGGVG